jgi:peptide/nickel transport system permease protein
MCLRMTRASIGDIRGADYIRTAEAKGISPAAVTSRHIVPVALPPVVSLGGSYMPLMIGNVVLIEKVFDIPGVYRLIPHAIDVGNYPIIQGLVITTTIFVVIANGIVDIALAMIDPRVRTS